MVDSAHQSVPHLESREEAEELRQKLAAFGFREETILDRIGFQQGQPISGDNFGFLLWLTRQGDLLDLLIRLFLINVPVRAESLRQNASENAQILIKTGLLSLEDGLVRPLAKLLPCLGLLCAFDVRSPGPQVSLPADYVMGVAGSSITLAMLTIRKPGGQALDLGTGCGIQAMLAARHCEQVVATDRNPRALDFARFNAALNGFSNIEFLEGHLFEPVHGRTFDLIVSNPPFVISPENRYIYRDAGMRGDELCRRIVQEAPDFLSVGGYCQMLGNWVEDRSRDWYERPRTWFEAGDCDGWIMRSHTQEAAIYASKWIGHTEFSDGEDRARRFHDWLSYFESQGIEQIGYGLISMRRSGSGKRWFHAEDSPSEAAGHGWGDSLDRLFQLRDFLEATGEDDALLDNVFSVSSHVCLTQRLKPGEGGWQLSGSTLNITKGLTYSGTADALAIDLLSECDGVRSLREVIARLSAATEIDVESLAPPTCRVVRSLVQKGFLLPAGVPGRPEARNPVQEELI